jgi:hypothetical protein
MSHFPLNIILYRILKCIIQSSGLNCAEAVNFAPADWLPHGGIGADLYRLYRKSPVLSHEELLYVVAKVRIPTPSDSLIQYTCHFRIPAGHFFPKNLTINILTL